jgi:four helix bundle protein
MSEWRSAGEEDGGRKTGDGEKGQVTDDGRWMMEGYKFQKLEVYQLALAYVDTVYNLCQLLPESEKYNLASQLHRASTSIVLNIAEGSTGQTDAEQSRFLGLALRSYLETVACTDLIEHRAYFTVEELLEHRKQGHQLFIKLSAFRKVLR